MSDQINISDLTPAQLAQLADAMKAQAKQRKARKDERNVIIDRMIATKGSDGFLFTTKEIAEALQLAGIGVELSIKAEYEQEIRRIQARCQHLRKLTGKDGELVHPEGSFGYKSGANPMLGGSKIKVETVMSFFETRASELTAEQKAEILKTLG